MGCSVCAVVPALNEQESVGEVVASLLLGGVADTVIVVDDHSSDHTAEAASAAGAQVVVNPGRRGKGNAVRTGVQVAQALDPEYVLFVDADLGECAEEMASALRKVKEGVAHMAVAGFAVSAGGGFGAAVAVARWGVRSLAGVRLEYPLCGQRAMLARSLLDVVGRFGLEEGFGLEVGLAIDWLRSGYTIVEVPTAMRHAGLGRGPRGLAHRARQFAAIGAALSARAGRGRRA